MQVTAEFLLLFAATLALISVLASALVAQHSMVEGMLEDQQKIADAKRAARALESWLNDGKMVELDFQEEDIYFSADASFLVRHRGKIIEVKGVFGDDDAEPV